MKIVFFLFFKNTVIPIVTLCFIHRYLQLISVVLNGFVLTNFIHVKLPWSSSGFSFPSNQKFDFFVLFRECNRMQCCFVFEKCRIDSKMSRQGLHTIFICIFNVAWSVSDRKGNWNESFFPSSFITRFSISRNTRITCLN